MKQIPWVFLALLFVVQIVIAEGSGGYSDDSTWENLSPRTLVYAQVLTAPDAIFDNSPCQSDANLIENRFRFGASMTVTERHTILDRGSNIRVRTVTADCVEILPQRRYQYIESSNPVYIETNFLHLILPGEFAPILLPGEVPHSPDRLIVVNKEDYTVTALYGTHVDGRFMARMGPTPVGDHRTYRASIATDMVGFNAVPWGIDFGGGYYLHGAPWWAWDEIARGSGGSHGCVNLPGSDWYRIQYDDFRMGVAQWLWRWNAANMSFDPATQDPSAWFVEIPSDESWYQVIDSVRVIVVNNLNELYNYPLTYRLGEQAAALSTVSSWDDVIASIHAVGDNFFLSNIDSSMTVTEEVIPAGVSIATSEGRATESPYVMLACDDTRLYAEPAYPGSSRTVGQVCRHLRIERNNSICTPERVDLDFLGKRTLCDGPRFDASTLDIRGELIEHENVHLVQFSGYFGGLTRQGIADDDLSPGWIDWHQISTIGITELMAQIMNVGSPLDEDYKFVLVAPDAQGELQLIDNEATTSEAWQHLHNQCGDPGGLDVDLDSLMTSALYGDADVYAQLQSRCSLPLYQLVPDRWR